MRAAARRVRTRLDAGDWPRLHVLLVVVLAAAGAFLVSAGLLFAHVRWMAWRYGIAAVAGYAAFLVLMRGWIQWKQSRFVDNEQSGVDVSALSFGGSPSSGGGSGRIFSGSGGRSGGGGASMAWDSDRPAPVPIVAVQPTPRASTTSSPVSSSRSSSGGLSLDVDGDDLFWLLVALAAICGGLLAIAYVVYIAPTLVSEAALNAAVAGRVYRGLARRDPAHLMSGLVRRTVAAAIVLVASAALCGYALQKVAPEAVSIGGVLAHMGAFN